LAVLRPSLTLLALLCATAGVHAQEAARDAPVTEAVPKQTPPTAKKKVPPRYPDGETARIKVVVAIDLDARGRVTHVQVKESGGAAFDQAAIAAVNQWEFEPARIDGAPTSSRVEVALSFVPPKVVKKLVPPAPVEKGTLAGIILLRGTRSPVAGGRVILVQSDQHFMAEIGEDGHFTVAAPPGRWHVIANGPKAKRFETDETLRAGETITVKYFIEPSQYTRYESVVRADLNREEISRQTLSREELVKIPGTGGDALRAIENLPGSARAPFNSGLIIVRGGRPTDSKVYIGTSEVPM
jgi:TonB family protein